jgi:hypothetical protein
MSAAATFRLLSILALALPTSLAAAADESAIVWNVDRIDQLGEHKTTVLGTPRLVETKEGKAVQFDGTGDALFIDANPLAGLKPFTVEVIFQPQADGPKEQRFLHFQEASSENRLLFETRLTDDGRWFLDTYIKSGASDATLFAKESLHAIGPWYHAAVVVDGKTMRHFVGGKEELKADLPFEPLGKGQTSLGVRINKVFWYKGAVRQIKITPRALTPIEFASMEGLHKIDTHWGEMRLAAELVELLILRQPEGGVLQIPRLNNPIKVAYVRGDAAKSPLNLTPGVREWSIDVSRVPGGAVGQTVILETVGRPHVPTIPRIVGASPDGSIVLGAHDAVTHGENLRYEPQPHKNTVGYWTNKDDWCEWQCYIEQPGKYEVRILQGCGKDQGGSEVDVRIGDQSLAFTVEDTGHFQNFKERSLGTVTLAGPQVHSLQIRPRKKAAAAVMDVRQVRLIPIAD